MRSAVILTILLILPLSLWAERGSEIDQFLSSRQILGSVHFPMSQVRLEKESAAAIDRLVPKLRSYLQQQNRLVRIEGFSSRKEAVNAKMPLSLQRSLAVKDYLKEKHQLKIDIYLTGFGEKHQQDAKLTNAHRVDIAVYELNPAARSLFDETGNVERYKLQ